MITIFLFIIGALILLAIWLYTREHFMSAEHIISANGNLNLKNNFSNDFSLNICEDKCLSLNKGCPNLTNIFIIHDSGSIIRDGKNDLIWAITDVMSIKDSDWTKNFDKYKSQGWVPCGKNVGTIQGVYPEPLDTNIGNMGPTVYLCVKYEKVNINSDTKILTSIKSSHFPLDFP